MPIIAARTPRNGLISSVIPTVRYSFASRLLPMLAVMLVSATATGQESPSTPPKEPGGAADPLIVTESPSGPTEPAPEAAPSKTAPKYQIEKGLAMFNGIQDDAIFPWADTGPRQLIDVPTDRMEERAYDEVIRHARQFTTAELEANARRDLTLKDLYTNGRLSYKLELVYFEGWLRRLRKAEPTEIMKASGINELYEAWIFPGGIDPICVYVTELPPGLSPQTDLSQPMNRYVSIAGYYFKLLRYEAEKPSRDILGEHQYRRAPVIMGRSLTLRDEPESTSVLWRQSFTPILLGGVGLIAFVIIGLSWYFRRGDALVRREIEKKLTDNPFVNG